MTCNSPKLPTWYVSTTVVVCYLYECGTRSFRYLLTSFVLVSAIILSKRLVINNPVMIFCIAQLSLSSFAHFNPFNFVTFPASTGAANARGRRRRALVRWSFWTPAFAHHLHDLGSPQGGYMFVCLYSSKGGRMFFVPVWHVFPLEVPKFTCSYAKILVSDPAADANSVHWHGIGRVVPRGYYISVEGLSVRQHTRHCAHYPHFLPGNSHFFMISFLLYAKDDLCSFFNNSHDNSLD